MKVFLIVGWSIGNVWFGFLFVIGMIVVGSVFFEEVWFDFFLFSINDVFVFVICYCLFLNVFDFFVEVGCYYLLKMILEFFNWGVIRVSYR